MFRNTGYEQKNSVVLKSAVGDGLLNRKLQLSTSLVVVRDVMHSALYHTLSYPNGSSFDIEGLGSVLHIWSDVEEKSYWSLQNHNVYH
jgi:hypothetical protein